ncbi:MAG TPA: hypothetical protein VMR99_01915 [Candidatus Paceibacterota bacterium]|nr:hypothetical protein [Candidatus Paceibacterota bacterium]
MEKNFKGWNKKKQSVHFTYKKRLHFSEGEIWFCTLGVNIGFEQDGSGSEFLRPVAVLKKITEDQFLGIPLTRTVRSGEEYLSLADECGPSIALLAQIRFLDAKRLVHFSKKMTAGSFEELKTKFIDLIKSYPRPIHRWDIYGAGEHVNPITDLPQGQEDGLHIYNNPDNNIVK